MNTNCSNSVLHIGEVTPLKVDDGEQNEDNSGIKKDDNQIHWLLRRVHILTWIRSYDRTKAVADLIAGITLGMTMIPQSIAYAALAGLSSQYGLYSAFVGSFAYVIFGTIPQVSIGPTSLMALLTLQYTMDLPVEFVIMLAFISGIVELALGVFNLGFIVNFISLPVTSAFTTGTASIVMLVQLKSLMGVKAKNFSIDLSNLMDEVRLGDSILGFTCIAILLSLRQLSRINIATTSSSRRFLKKFLWYISISRNAIVVFSSSLIAYTLVSHNGRDNIPFALSTKVNATTLSVQLPPFVIIHDNTTYSFLDICNELGSGIFVVPFVAVLANVAIAKAFVKDTSLDASQEMFTLGICNIAGSFCNAMPTCGAFTRSAVNEASGVKTPLSGIYSGGLVLLALGILTPYFQYIPKSALSAVLITAVLFMLDFQILKKLWVISKKDFFNWVGVVIVCIAGGVELGLLFGIVTNMFFMAMRLANPKIEAIVRNINGQYFIHAVPSTDIYYAGADHLRNKIKSICVKSEYKYPVVIECEKFTQYDYTLTNILESIIKDLEEKNVRIYLQSSNYETRGIYSNFKSKAIFCNDELDLEKMLMNNK